MTENLTIDGNTLAYDVTGEGPLVVLAHGIGDSRHAYRFIAPALAAAGYLYLTRRNKGPDQLERSGPPDRGHSETSQQQPAVS